jgi:succinate-semialdehyde dehydrogenase/glutarate-semialdehyde dehydrogenase
MYDRYGLSIRGVWQKAGSGATSPVQSPLTELSLGDCPVASVEDTLAAITAAEAGLGRDACL